MVEGAAVFKRHLTVLPVLSSIKLLFSTLASTAFCAGASCLWGEVITRAIDCAHHMIADLEHQNEYLEKARMVLYMERHEADASGLCSGGDHRRRSHSATFLSQVRGPLPAAAYIPLQGPSHAQHPTLARGRRRPVGPLTANARPAAPRPTSAQSIARATVHPHTCLRQSPSSSLLIVYSTIAFQSNAQQRLPLLPWPLSLDALTWQSRS